MAENIKSTGNKKYHSLVTIIAILIVFGIIGIIVGIEIHNSSTDKVLTDLYKMETALEEWKEDFDPENPEFDDILSLFSQQTFRQGSYAENRRIYSIGEIYELTSEPLEAASYFLQVAESARGYFAPASFLKAALLYEEAGDIPKARELLTKLVTDYDYQEEPRALFSLGRLAESDNDYETATQFYNQLIDNYASSEWKNLAYNRIISLSSASKINE